MPTRKTMSARQALLLQALDRLAQDTSPDYGDGSYVPSLYDDMGMGGAHRFGVGYSNSGRLFGDEGLRQLGVVDFDEDQPKRKKKGKEPWWRKIDDRVKDILASRPVEGALNVLTTPSAAVTSGLKEFSDFQEGQGFSPGDLWDQVYETKKRINASDFIYGSPEGYEGDPIAPAQSGLTGWLNDHADKGIARFATGFGADVATDPLTYVGVGAAAKGTKAVTEKIASNAAKEVEETIGRKAIVEAAKRGERGLEEIEPTLHPRVAARVGEIQNEAADAIARARKGGANALSPEEAARWGVDQGIKLKLPGKQLSITTGGNRIGTGGKLSQARYGAQQRAMNILFGEGEAKRLGKLLPNAEHRALARSGDPMQQFKSTLTNRMRDTVHAQQKTYSDRFAGWYNQAIKGHKRADIDDAFDAINGDEEAFDRLAKAGKEKLVKDISKVHERMGGYLVNKGVLKPNQIIRSKQLRGGYSYTPHPIHGSISEAMTYAKLWPGEDMLPTHARGFFENRRKLWDPKTKQGAVGHDLPEMGFETIPFEAKTRAEADRRAGEILLERLRDPDIGGEDGARWLAEHPEFDQYVEQGYLPLFKTGREAMADYAGTAGRRIAQTEAGHKLYMAGFGTLRGAEFGVTDADIAAHMDALVNLDDARTGARELSSMADDEARMAREAYEGASGAFQPDVVPSNGQVADDAAEAALGAPEAGPPEAAVQRLAQMVDENVSPASGWAGERVPWVGAKPWEMDREAFIKEYKNIEKAIAAAEKSGDTIPAELRAAIDRGQIDMNSERFSRARGYTDEQIRQFRRWLELNGDNLQFDYIVEGPEHIWQQWERMGRALDAPAEAEQLPLPGLNGQRAPVAAAPAAEDPREILRQLVEKFEPGPHDQPDTRLLADDLRRRAALPDTTPDTKPSFDRTASASAREVFDETRAKVKPEITKINRRRKQIKQEMADAKAGKVKPVKINKARAQAELAKLEAQEAELKAGMAARTKMDLEDFVHPRDVELPMGTPEEVMDLTPPELPEVVPNQWDAIKAMERLNVHPLDRHKIMQGDLQGIDPQTLEEVADETLRIASMRNPQITPGDGLEVVDEELRTTQLIDERKKLQKLDRQLAARQKKYTDRTPTARRTATAQRRQEIRDRLDEIQGQVEDATPASDRLAEIQGRIKELRANIKRDPKDVNTPRLAWRALRDEDIQLRKRLDELKGELDTARKNMVEARKLEDATPKFAERVTPDSPLEEALVRNGIEPDVLGTGRVGRTQTLGTESLHATYNRMTLKEPLEELDKAAAKWDRELARGRIDEATWATKQRAIATRRERLQAKIASPDKITAELHRRSDIMGAQALHADLVEAGKSAKEIAETLKAQYPTVSSNLYKRKPTYTEVLSGGGRKLKKGPRKPDLPDFGERAKTRMKFQERVGVTGPTGKFNAVDDAGTAAAGVTDEVDAAARAQAAKDATDIRTTADKIRNAWVQRADELDAERYGNVGEKLQRLLDERAEQPAAVQELGDGLTVLMPDADTADEMIHRELTHAVATQIDTATEMSRNPELVERMGEQLELDLRKQSDLPALEETQQWRRIYREARRNKDPELQQVAELHIEAASMRRKLDSANVKYDNFARKVEAMKDDTKLADQMSHLVVRSMEDALKYRSIAPGFLTPTDMADAVLQFEKFTHPSEMRLVARTYLRAVHWIKVMQITNPGFHIRNLFGGVFNNALADIDVGSYGSFVKAYMKVKTGQIKRLTPKERQLWGRLVQGLDPGQAISESGFGNPLARLAKGPKYENRALEVGRKFLPTTHNYLSSLSARAGGEVEFFLRGSLMWDTLKKGGSLDDAVTRMHKFHFNYEDLSSFDQKVKRFIPFYTFTRNNLPLQMEMLVQNPKWYARYAMARDEVENMSAADPIVPGYFAEAGAIRLPFKGDDEQHNYYIPDLPLRDLNLLGAPGELLGSEGDIGQRVGNAASQPLSMVTPLLTAPVEHIMGKSFYKGIPLRDDRPVPLDNLPGWLQGAMRFTPFVSNQGNGDYISERDFYLLEKLIPPLARIRRGTSDEPKMQDRRLGFLLSFLLGQQVRHNSLEEQETATYLQSEQNRKKRGLERRMYENQLRKQGVPEDEIASRVAQRVADERKVAESDRKRIEEELRAQGYREEDIKRLVGWRLAQEDG